MVEIWNLVVPFLYSTSDMWRLRQTCKPLRDLIKGSIVQSTNVKIIRSRLFEMCIDPDELSDLLIKTNSVLSGSFLVQCIVGDKWADSDIDVFGHVKQKYILTKRSQIVPNPSQVDIRTPIHSLELLPWRYINKPFQNGLDSVLIKVEPKTDQPNPDEPKIEESKTDQSTINESKTDQSTINEPKIEDSKKNEPKKNQKVRLQFPKSSGGFNNEYSGIIGFAYSRKYILPTPQSKIVSENGRIYVDNGTIFNFVGTRINAKEYIKKCFDISFCKNYFDGKKMTIIHPYHVLSRIGKLVRFTNSMNFIHAIPKKVYSRICKYKSRGFHIRRHSEYNGLEELVKFRKYEYYISRDLKRNTRFRYQFPEKFDKNNFTALKLECKSLNVIKIQTLKYRYIIIRFNRPSDIPIYILFNISNEDTPNLLKYAVNGLKNVMRKFWYFESMNPSIDVTFNYLSNEMNASVCDKKILDQLIVG